MPSRHSSKTVSGGTYIFTLDHDIINSKGVDTMKSKYTPNEKQDVISRHQDGQSVTQISQETGVPKSTIYA